MMILRVFLEAKRIRLHTGRPRAGFFVSPLFFLSSSILGASSSPLAPGPSSATHRGASATRTLARRSDAAQRGSVTTASVARQEGPAAARRNSEQARPNGNQGGVVAGLQQEGADECVGHSLRPPTVPADRYATSPAGRHRSSAGSRP